MSILLLAIILGSAGHEAFAANAWQQQCEAKLAPTTVAVTTEPSSIHYDFTKSAAELSRMAPISSGGVTLGLTAISRQFNAGWKWAGLEQRNGDACIRPAISVALTVNPQTVYVAREFPQGSCAFNAIVQHELRHVHVNQDHLETVADYYQKAIADAFGQQIFYGSAAGLKAAMQDSFHDYWGPFLKADLAKSQHLHNQIDTPEEYARNKTLCQGEIVQRLKAAGFRY